MAYPVTVMRCTVSVVCDGDGVGLPPAPCTDTGGALKESVTASHSSALAEQSSNVRTVPTMPTHKLEFDVLCMTPSTHIREDPVLGESYSMMDPSCASVHPGLAPSFGTPLHALKTAG